MILELFLITMAALAFIALNTSKLRRAILYLGAFSLVSSFVYLLYQAPDVAIAEAVIGSALTTVLYLVALRKHKIFTIYYTNDDFNEINDGNIIKGRAFVLRDLERYFMEKEMEPQIIYTTDRYEDILGKKDYDLLIFQKRETLYLYGGAQDYQVDEIEALFGQSKYDHITLHMIRETDKEEIDET